MFVKTTNDYDVVIIGAGIGGLVAGCLLAHAGASVLIVEKNSQPGGYCTSFKIQNQYFDSFVHSLGNISEGNQFHNLLVHLQIKEKLNLIRFNPTDIINTPDYSICYFNQVEKTIDSFVKVFPSEHTNIEYFFKKIVNDDKLDSVVNLRNKTFRRLLDTLFRDEKLKNTLSLVILGNMGVSSNQISAFTAVKHYRQFMLDGGYYPKAGIHALPDALCCRFKELGGNILFSKTVNSISTSNNSVKGIVLKDETRITSKFVVSDCDSRQTFLHLIGASNLKAEIVEKLNSMKTSLSLAVVYLGLSDDSSHSLIHGVNSWFMFDYDYENIHSLDINYSSECIKWIMIRPNCEKKHLMIFANAPFNSEKYWKENRNSFANEIIKKAEIVCPRLSKNIKFRTTANPYVLYKWTGNFNGSAYGWASTPSQLMDPDFSRDSIVNNLFLCGHWSTLAQGVPGVSIVAERVSRIIIKRLGLLYKLN